MSEKIGAATHGDIVCWENFLAHADYKPGWAFSVVDLISKKAAIAARFRMLVWDTMRRNELVPLAVTTDYQVPEWLLGSRFELYNAQMWLRGRIHEIERHEADEWLRFNGVQVFNPHGPPQDLGRRPEGWEWMSPEALSIAPHLKEKPRA